MTGDSLKDLRVVIAGGSLGGLCAGVALRGRIESNLAQQPQPELSAIHLVRELSDLTAAMPRLLP